MSQVINTNIMSLTAQNNLNKSQSSLAQAMQRLSSGLRINSSADDAAGFAIAGRMTTQINGLDQASRNANDAVSLAQTTSAALQQITSNLQSIRQLAVQAANATNSDSDRDALDAAVQQSLDEITRVAQQTTFNGRRVLDGSFGTAAFQVGANVGETISIDLSKGTGASQIGQIAQATTTGFVTTTGSAATAGSVAAGSISDNTAAMSFKINGTEVSITADTGRSSLGDVATAFNTALQTAGLGYTAAASGSGVSLTATTPGADAMGITDATGLSFGAATAGTAAVAAGTTPQTISNLTIDGKSVTAGSYTAQGLADAINAQGISGVSAYVSAGTNPQLVVESNSSDGTLTFGGSDATTLGLNASVATSGNLVGANVKSVAGANDVINRVDSALSAVSSIDSQLGAMQNRFNSAIANAQAVSQNLSASRSRIQDADFAAETAAMSQSQILQQAGISMLAQANAAPQLVLKLLQ